MVLLQPCLGLLVCLFVGLPSVLLCSLLYQLASARPLYLTYRLRLHHADIGCHGRLGLLGFTPLVLNALA